MVIQVNHKVKKSFMQLLIKLSCYKKNFKKRHHQGKVWCIFWLKLINAQYVVLLQFDLVS